MLLGQQVQSILYHLMMGWLYGCTFSFLEYLLKYVRFRFLKGTGEILFHLVFTLLMFRGLFFINGGVTNLYLIALFLVGVYLFYRFYFMIFTHIYKRVGRFFKPLFQSLSIAKKKFVGIIKVPIKKWKRRRKLRERSKKHSRHEENGKEEASPA